MRDTNQIALRHGVILGIGLTIFGVAFRVADISIQSPIAWMFYVSLGIGAWVTIRQVRHSRVDASFRTQFTAGSYSTVLASVIYSSSVFLYNHYIDASLLVEVEQYLRMTAIVAGKSGESLEQAIRIAEIFTQPVLFAVAVFIQLAITGIGSAFSVALWNRYRRQHSEPSIVPDA